MPDNQLSDWLAWLEKQHPLDIDLGLKRIDKVAKSLGITDFDAQIVTVAGTNGKGSFVKALSTILIEHGKQVATYTSPHFIHFNERISFNHSYASDEEIVAAFKIVEAARNDIPLSYFEFTTLAALYLFSQQTLDVIILEVGLGGRLDAVNIIEPDLAVITSIGLDHQAYLGNTLDKIAYEKCGILRENTPLVNCEREVPEYLSKTLQHRTSWSIGVDFDIDYKPGKVNSYHNQATQKGFEFAENGLSPDSMAAALFVAETFFKINLQEPSMVDSIEKMSLPGRFQRFIDKEIEVILDVAHNVQAASLLSRRLKGMNIEPGNKRLAVFNVFNDKDIDGIITILHEQFDAWFLGEVDNPRAMKCEDLSEIIAVKGNQRISISRNIRQAYARARSLCEAGDQIIVFGSFSVVAEILPRLQSGKMMLPDNNEATVGQLTG